MDIQFEIEEQTLARVSETEHPATGSKNYLKCKFQFNSEDWDTLVKLAVFKNEQGIEFTKYLGRGNYGECFVPHEALRGDYFTVYVYGGDLITTNEVIVMLMRSGYKRQCGSCDNGQQDVFVDVYDEIDTKISKEELDDVYCIAATKVDEECFDGFFDNRMRVWVQDLIDGINQL